MYLSDLVENPPGLPTELGHLRSGSLAEGMEQAVADRISGRLNAVLGIGTRSLTGRIAKATCPRGDVFIIHPSEVLLNFVMDEILQDRETNVDVRRARLDKIPALDGTFDTVFLLLQLHHEDNPEATLREARRVLAPDGRLVVLETAGHGDPGAHSLVRGSVPSSLATLEDWLSRAGFALLRKDVEEGGFQLREGTTTDTYDALLVEAAPENRISTQRR